jgi:hypothetical protein
LAENAVNDINFIFCVGPDTNQNGKKNKMADILEKYSKFCTIKSKINQKWMLLCDELWALRGLD